MDGGTPERLPPGRAGHPRRRTRGAAWQNRLATVCSAGWRRGHVTSSAVRCTRESCRCGATTNQPPVPGPVPDQYQALSATRLRGRAPSRRLRGGRQSLSVGGSARPRGAFPVSPRAVGDQNTSRSVHHSPLVPRNYRIHTDVTSYSHLIRAAERRSLTTEYYPVVPTHYTPRMARPNAWHTRA